MNIFIITLLVYVFQHILIENMITRFEKQYQSTEDIISNSFITLEKNSENSAIATLKLFRDNLKSILLPSDDKLKLIANQLGVSQIAATDVYGQFIRDTVTPENERTKKLFDFCDDYKNMTVPGADKIFVTPIIPAFPSKGPYKFIMISDPYHKGVLEVGVKLEFIAKLLSFTIKSDQNIASIGFFTPSANVLGMINQSGEFVEDNVTLLHQQPLRLAIEKNISYIKQKNIYIDNSDCCECNTKNISTGDGRYYYLMQMEISTADLVSSIKDLKNKSFFVFSLLIFLSIILSNFLANYLVRRLYKLNNSINEIINKKNLNIDISISGNDEISFISNNFNKMLSMIRVYEKSQIETEINKTLIKIASQVSHDIRSPLAALNSMLSQISQVPEDKRIIIRNSVNRINDIANSLLQKSKSHIAGTDAAPTTEMGIELLPAVVDSLVSEKRIQYRDKIGVQIEEDLNSGYGLFANINITEFKRVLSNLINNAVEAFPNETGRIRIALSSKDHDIYLIIQDNGKGILPHILSRLGKEGITSGKKDTNSGTGLGIYHAKQTIEHFSGKFEVTSSTDSKLTSTTGTTITITLPKATAPDWFVENLVLEQGTKIITLDDDLSIHGIWKGRFQSKHIESHRISHISFTSGEDFSNWVKQQEKNNILFLVDYELLNQNKTGLDLVEELNLGGRAILVSSRYEEPQIRARCARLNVKLIPKSMAGFVPIKFKSPKIKYDAILIDDDVLIHMAWNIVATDLKKSILCFENEALFLNSANSIDLNTPIYIDVNLANGVSGLVVAKGVFDLGFKNIHLATGYDADSIDRPQYIKSIIGKDFPLN
ncbi:MAG TPA: HAMP domain-containing sensor histidine kinase [Pseudobdellovibrionaceae bacterium]|nr:HAMP domain-containing sensor histidine kinase [Pseudobdellovibrionaceae bacterium]